MCPPAHSLSHCSSITASIPMSLLMQWSGPFSKELISSSTFKSWSRTYTHRTFSSITTVCWLSGPTFIFSTFNQFLLLEELLVVTTILCTPRLSLWELALRVFFGTHLE